VRSTFKQLLDNQQPINDIRTVGIIGAGKLGTTLARHLLDAGYDVLISGSGGVDRLALVVDVLLPGARPAVTADVIAHSHLVILALPLGRLHELPAAAFEGVLTVDTMNYWEPVDGHLPAFANRTGTSSELVASMLPGARLVKAFSHLGYHDLDDLARPRGDPARVGLALAGNDPAAVATVARVVDRLGFDPADIGSLANSAILEAGHPLFGRPVTAEHLEKLEVAHSRDEIANAEAASCVAPARALLRGQR
jgi:predicted dinucleotide-binding enzyme